MATGDETSAQTLKRHILQARESIEIDYDEVARQLVKTRALYAALLKEAEASSSSTATPTAMFPFSPILETFNKQAVALNSNMPTPRIHEIEVDGKEYFVELRRIKKALRSVRELEGMQHLVLLTTEDHEAIELRLKQVVDLYESGGGVPEKLEKENVGPEWIVEEIEVIGERKSTGSLSGRSWGDF